MLNNAFSESGMLDMGKLMPIMFVVILALTLLILRSLSATLATLGVILLSSMGFEGFAGIKLTPISGAATVVILTLAIADSVHILISLRTSLHEGMDKVDALTEALRLNFLPVLLLLLERNWGPQEVDSDMTSTKHFLQPAAGLASALFAAGLTPAKSTGISPLATVTTLAMWMWVSTCFAAPRENPTSPSLTTASTCTRFTSR